MSHSSERAAMTPIHRCVRAYFAPVDRQLDAPAVFDPAKHARFDLDAPPAPWIDLGWIDQFSRLCVEENDALCSGSPSLPKVPFRRSLSSRLEFNFRSWGKLQMALACGSQHINILAAEPNTAAEPLGGTPIPPIAVLPGSTATEIFVGSGGVSLFQAGDLIVVDIDYQQQIGYVGTGVAAAYVRDPADVAHDPDFIRRVTFNVGRIAVKTATSLVLAQPLLGGPPPAGCSVQKVVAFADREGGSFLQEWSGLFVFQEDAGGRLCLYYPRLVPSPPPGNAGFRRESTIDVADPIRAIALHGVFLALPYVDNFDNEPVLSYRYYFPSSQAAVY